jgi:hypothetical protein
VLIVACGSAGARGDDLPSLETPEISGDTPLSGFQVIGTAQAFVKDGQLHFEALRPVTSGPQTKVQNFGPGGFTQGDLLFSTNPGAGLGTGNCTATQYCATVVMTNGTGRKLDDLFVEITGYQDIVPPTETISWAGAPFTYSQAYASAFANPSHIEAAFYGDSDVNQHTAADWKFNVGAAQAFEFTLAVLASVHRSQYTLTTQTNAATVDACVLPGHSEYLMSTDDAETEIALPFPFTLYDKTYDRVVLGSNGYALFEHTGDAVPTLGAGATNSSLTSGPPPGLYPFWDDLAFDADGGVCVATTGTGQNQTLAITWKNAKINAAQPAKGNWSTSRVTNTVTLAESSDQIVFEYLLPDAGVTTLTRGASATIGDVGIVNGVQTGQDLSNNSLALNIPSGVTAYPFQVVLSPDRSATTYPVSADGKFYYVNLLRRNYYSPVASATFANDATQTGANAPPAVFDGDDAGFVWGTPTASDPDATATLIVDMGQYFSVGAVRPFYSPFYTQPPASHRIRLATTLGNWTEVVPMSPAIADSTLSFSATPARYVEFTMLGSNSLKSVDLTELFVYPSAQTSPPPTSASGYDLSYFSTSSTVNSNFFPPGVQWPLIWPAGAFDAKSNNLTTTATGDAVGVVDLGAQFQVSRLAACFFFAPAWQHGGQLEVAAIPDAYTTVYDSGRGNQFGSVLSGCGEDLAIPTQPVRYIRATDYFMPGGVGLSNGALWSVQAFGEPAPLVAYYPTNPDNLSFNVNLLRRPPGVLQPTISVVYANGALQSTATQTRNPANVMDDMDGTSFAFQTTAANPNATATLTIDLGQVESVGAIHLVFTRMSFSYSLRAAPTLAAWTQVVADTPVPSGNVGNVSASFAAISARYLELTLKGTSTALLAAISEFQALPSVLSDPAPSSTSQLDLSYLTGVTFTQDANLQKTSYFLGHPPQFAFGGKTVAQGAFGDGAVTIDLGQQYQISQIGLSFGFSTNWAAGGKVDIDDGSGTWSAVFDSGRGTALGIINTVQTISFSQRPARRIRITDYFVPGVGCSTGWLANVAVF